MYNLKRIIRQKSSWVLIIIFIVIFILMFFLFKYIFVVQNNIEINVYDKLKNRDIIIYEDYDKINAKLNKYKDILFVYHDYQLLEVESDIASFMVSANLREDMPPLIKGEYPKNENEIILPEYIAINGTKIDLTAYLNKSINFALNNEVNVSLYVTGIYDNKNTQNIIYNLKNIDYLLKKLPSYNYTGYTRAIINHYKNYEKLKNNLNISLYDTSGLEEIEVYKSLYNLVLFIIILMIIFVVIILLVISSILFNNSKNTRFIQFIGGFNQLKITNNYIYYYIKIMIISFCGAFLGFIFMMVLYKCFINTDNLVLNSLFSLSINHLFLLPIIILILINIFILYVFIYFKVSLDIKKI